MVEAGIGFGFLAVVISYLPVLYQAFSRREITISLLDARAGSPPTAGELLRRLADAAAGRARADLAEWSAGPPSCWRAISRFRCSATIARSTTINRGSAADHDLDTSRILLVIAKGRRRMAISAR